MDGIQSEKPQEKVTITLQIPAGVVIDQELKNRISGAMKTCGEKEIGEITPKQGGSNNSNNNNNKRRSIRRSRASKKLKKSMKKKSMNKRR